MSIGKIFLGLVLASLLVPGLVAYSSERGGEVVTLRTYSEGGYDFSTKLWIIDDHRTLYVRAIDPDAGWLARLRVNPRVELIRDGRVTVHEAVPVPKLRDRVNYLMAQRYGWANQVVGFTRDTSRAVPVRLQRPPE